MTPKERREWLKLDLESCLIGPWQRFTYGGGFASESFSLERQGRWMTRGVVRFVRTEAGDA